MGITDSEIERAERFGSRAFVGQECYRCRICERNVDIEYDEYLIDYVGKIFCSDECYKKYYENI